MGGKFDKKEYGPYIRRSGDAKAAMAQVQKNLQAVLDGIRVSAGEGLKGAAEAIHQKSLDYAPKEFGALRKSAYVAHSEQNGVTTYEIGFGEGGDPGYTIFTHEIGPYANPTTPGTDYKYLQRAVTELEADIIDDVASQIKEGMR